MVAINQQRVSTNSLDEPPYIQPDSVQRSLKGVYGGQYRASYIHLAWYQMFRLTNGTNNLRMNTANGTQLQLLCNIIQNDILTKLFCSLELSTPYAV